MASRTLYTFVVRASNVIGLSEDAVESISTAGIPYNMKYWRRFILAISSEKHIGEFYFGDLIPGSLGY